MTQASGRQHLLIDADDTLWENNIYFEDAFDEFVNFLGHSSMSAAEVRAVLADWSPALPPRVFASPMCMRALRKVPVVRMTAEARYVVSPRVLTPTIRLFSIRIASTISWRSVRFVEMIWPRSCLLPNAFSIAPCS